MRDKIYECFDFDIHPILSTILVILLIVCFPCFMIWLNFNQDVCGLYNMITCIGDNHFLYNLVYAWFIEDYSVETAHGIATSLALYFNLGVFLMPYFVILSFCLTWISNRFRGY